ncbi:MAG: CPBP family intramembrane metalloprotease [Prevotellaceae bacterium]|jgi:membrane protease YdiL (CAAX protease family)|nr:CPBP family intramembrane metalloprotease [Prevotellaceae bacterium]
MRKAIRLALVYLVIQLALALLTNLVATHFAPHVPGGAQQLYNWLTTPTLLLSIVLMSLYLWKKGYLRNNGRAYAPTTAGFLAWTVIIGLSTIVLVEFLMTLLPPIPNLMESGFEVIQSNAVGILALVLLGPILEELLFRRAVMEEMLTQYKPAVVIVLQALLFALIHLNPAQMVGAALVGAVLGWIYYRTRSVIPCIVLHVLNNSISVYFKLHYPQADSLFDLTTRKIYWVLIAAVFFLAALQRIQSYSPSKTNN